MCFSATGSFVVSGVLTGLGMAALAHNSSKRHRVFAAIPLLFAAQQAAEGTVWLTMGAPGTLVHRVAVSAYLGFALVLWPTWVPLSLRLIERSAFRRRVLTGLLVWGAIASGQAAFLLMHWQPTARIAGHSISYDYARRDDALTNIIYLVGYISPTVVPFFVSTVGLSRVIGTVLVGSVIATAIIRREAFASVWCFFAAILSGLILVVIGREQRAAAGGALHVHAPAAQG